MNFKVAPYTPGDEGKILELFRLVYNREMTGDYWRWRFADNPAGSRMIDLCWDGSTLAGHYAVSPVKMVINGREYLTALSMTTMTHPDYRKKGIFTTLARSLYRRLENEGVVMIWGFPNNNSYHGFMTKLNWFPLARIPKLAINRFQKGQLLPGRSRPEIIDVDRMDHRFDELWHQVDKSGVNMVVRDSRYLQWRYFDNPVNNYKIFAWQGSTSIAGYVILKTYRGISGEDGEIVDLIAINNEINFKLISHAVNYFFEQGVYRITIWLNARTMLNRAAVELGFKPTDELTHLGAMVNGTQISQKDVNDYTRWFVTMGDSDIY